MLAFVAVTIVTALGVPAPHVFDAILVSTTTFAALSVILTVIQWKAARKSIAGRPPVDRALTGRDFDQALARLNSGTRLLFALAGVLVGMTLIGLASVNGFWTDYAGMVLDFRRLGMSEQLLVLLIPVAFYAMAYGIFRIGRIATFKWTTRPRGG